MFVLFFLFSPTQKAFHADVVSVMKKWPKEEDFLPEDEKLTSQAREHYVKVSFPPLPVSHAVSLFLESHLSLILAFSVFMITWFGSGAESVDKQTIKRL